MSEQKNIKFGDYETTIQGLSSIEAVRKRPTFYLGPLDNPNVLSNLVVESLSIARLKKDVSVIDIYVNENLKALRIYDYGKLALEKFERLLTDLHIGNLYGIFVVNALSRTFSVFNRIDGTSHILEYEKGKLIDKEIEQGEHFKDGTTIYFQFDEEIFGDLKIDKNDLIAEIEKFKTETLTINLRFE